MRLIHSTKVILIILIAGQVVWSIPKSKQFQLEGVGSIYIETEQRFNWFDAWNECAIQNMTLIAIDTAEKNAALTAILKDNSVKVNLWIGGNDLAVEGRFVWFSSGKRFAFSNWSKGNPDNHNNGDCVNIWDLTDFEWNDASCNYTIGFICEDNPFLVTARRDLEMKKNFIEQVLTLK